MNLNEQQIVKKWSPMIESVTGIKDKEKLAWISKYAHYHALNESLGGVSAPYSTILNVPGVGDAVPASLAAVSGTQQTSPLAKGSGDKWMSILPMALQVAARTIAFDLVNVVPMPGATGIISYMDYVYAGGKQPFGAPPASSPSTANPASGYTNYESPAAFKIQLTSSDASALLNSLVNGDTVVFHKDTSADSNYVSTVYIGKSRIDGYPMFKVGSYTGVTNLAGVFDGAAVGINTSRSSVWGSVTTYPSVISTLEDQIQGFVGAGVNNTDNWEGTFVSGTTLYEPMSRGVGEQEYPKALGLQVFTKFVEAGTYQVAINVTLEQVQDLNKQWGIDVIAMVENAGINELSQSINKHILSRLFALGWKNHIKAYTVEGINLNLNVNSSTADTTPAFAYSENGSVTNAAMTCPGITLAGGATIAFENQDTIIKRIMTNILAAGNVVMQRGRRGPANFIVTNLKIATALQSNSGYTFSPITNTLNQSNGSLYPLGTIAGMTLYVDPNMSYTDTRVLVGRKGATDEPGVVFCPYLMAESVKFITEGTAAPKVIVKSRYALVDAGFHPETQYVTLYIKTGSGAVL